MPSPEEATEKFLDERPHLEDILETVIELDQEGPWSYDYLDCDSGNFGYIVSRPFVESVDGGYRLVDRDATKRALTTTTQTTPTSTGFSNYLKSKESNVTVKNRLNQIYQNIETETVRFPLILLLSVWLLFMMRMSTYQSVFRDEHVVLPGNDPYFYRYWVDQLLDASPQIFSFSEIAEVLGHRATGEPLVHALGWWLTRLFEGNPDTSGVTVAMIPVVASLIIGILIAWMALAVTDDERIAVLTVVSFAIFPTHSLYSAVGFFDHHALDYLWVTLMAASLFWLARDQGQQETGIEHITRPGTWGAASVFGVSVGVAMLSWNGAPILLLGVATFATFYSASLVRTSVSPAVVSLPIIAGLGLGTVIGHLMHTSAGWQEPLVVYFPLVVLAGVVGLVVLAEIVGQVRPDPVSVFVGAGGVGIAVLIGFRSFAPELFDRLYSRFMDSLLGREAIAETRSLISTDFGLFFGPVDHHGWWVFFAIPALALVTWRAYQKHEPEWLVLIGFAWPLLILAQIQLRFAGELSPFASIFAAVGIVWAFSKVDLTKELACFGDRTYRGIRPIRGLTSAKQGFYIGIALVIILVLGIFTTTAVMGAVTITDEEYEAAAWIEEHAETHDDRDFVLSRWGRNRMYNYIVNGESDSYWYAEQTYASFIGSMDPDRWYTEFSGRVGYIVIEDLRINPQTAQPERTYTQLFLFEGSATQQTDGVGHFQLLHRTEHGKQAIFRPVEGANLTGSGPADETVLVQTEVQLTEEKSFNYTRRTTTNENGTYEVRVAYPGEYRSSSGERRMIPEGAIENGEIVEMETGSRTRFESQSIPDSSDSSGMLIFMSIP